MRKHLAFYGGGFNHEEAFPLTAPLDAMAWYGGGFNHEEAFPLTAPLDAMAWYGGGLNHEEAFPRAAPLDAMAWHRAFESQRRGCVRDGEGVLDLHDTHAPRGQQRAYDSRRCNKTIDVKPLDTIL
jgi:hypothetical protein